jgi:NAD+ kinase
MQKLYIFVGSGKDADGQCRRAITEVVEKCGGSITENVSEASVIAALGGDGTIMRAAHLASEQGIPVIGINLGRIGYMAELDRSEIALVSKYFDGDYHEDARMMLTVRVGKDTYYALNDAVFHSQSRRMCKYTLTCNGGLVNEYRGDGVILATPTGSTAYSMSAGGSVIDPRLKCICVTPICTQSLTARPMIFSPDSSLSVTAQSDQCMITLDGQEPISLGMGETVTVEKSERKLRMIKLKKDGFYEVLRSKRQS